MAKAREVLRPVLDAFSGLDLMTLLPGGEAGTDGILESLTASNAASAIASLESWAAVHPTRAFEVELLVPSLRELSQALWRSPR